MTTQTLRTHGYSRFVTLFALCLLLLLTSIVAGMLAYSYATDLYGLHPVISIPVACIACFFAGNFFQLAVNEYDGR